MPVAWVQSRHHNYKINPEPAPPPPAPAPKPPRYTLPPPGADYVLVKSPDARRRSEIATLARNTVDGLHTVEVETTHDALDVLREAPKPPLIALVDAYDENDDGELDQDEMSWPLLRIVQRPCKPYKDHIRQTMVIFVSKTVHESPRHTLDVLSAGARISAEINQCVRPAWRYYLLFWPPRRSTRVLGVLARGVLGLFTRTFDFRTGTERASS